MFKNKRLQKMLVSATASLAACAIIPAAASAAEFRDVASTNSHSEAITTLSNLSVLKGYKDGTFKPNQPINRGQVTKILSRLYPGEGQLKQVFQDVPANSPDSELVKAAFEVHANGLMTGADGKLMPYSSMTRQQMAKIIVERMSLGHAEGKQSKVTDLDKAYPEFREYIEILSEHGITTATEFRPDEPVTRAQFASFLYRSIESFKATQ